MAITAAEIRETVAVLAADSLQGREAGTRGADLAARYVAERFAALGLRPPGVTSTARAPFSPQEYLQTFDLPPRVEPGPATRLSVAVSGDDDVAQVLAFTSSDELAPLSFSARDSGAGPLVAVPASRTDAAAGGRPPKVRGAVVLLAALSDPGPLREHVAELERAGAVGVVVVGDPAALATLGGEPAGVPVLALAPGGAERLAAAAGLDFLALVHGAPTSASRPAAAAVVADFVRSPRATANVVGVLPGADPRFAGEAVLIGAHYDHLGWGGPGSLAPGVREIHNGADDNASGVAGVLELAERFAARPPARTLVFAAFGAEETGLIGSRQYASSPAWSLARTVAMLNLDMIGRLRQRLTVYGTGTSPDWAAILDEAAAGVTLARVPDGLGPSDHATFYSEGLPVLAFFTGAHDDYHRPSDDAGRLDAGGEVRVLQVAAGVVERLAGARPRIAFAEAPVTVPRPTTFRVALGTIPDYGFAGPGLRLSAVRPGGPAARAGLESGDVLLRLAGREIADVYAYTAILADLEAGREVELVYERGGTRRTAAVVPESR